MADLYSVKMRAQQIDKQGYRRHISGAERIVAEEEIPSCLQALQKRGFYHAKGSADELFFKIVRVSEKDILRIPALPVTSFSVPNWQTGLTKMTELLSSVTKDGEQLVELLSKLENMRGAVLWDLTSGQRIEPDQERGVRVSNMDCRPAAEEDGEKHHFREALTLASKVLSCPGIVGELCISDDPNYVTGYLATREGGYMRISQLKPMGSARGGWIFLYAGIPEHVAECIDYLQNREVLVYGK